MAKKQMIWKKPLVNWLLIAFSLAFVCIGCGEKKIPATSIAYTCIKTRLSQEDIQFGERQMEQLARERPEICRLVTKEDAMWEWVVRQFAGEGGNGRIYWNSGELGDKGFEFNADCNYPAPGKPGYIRLRKWDKTGKPISAEKLLHGLVFELNNTRSGPEFDRIFQLAVNGKLSKEQWIEENTRIEYTAVQRTVEFYRKIFLPVALARKYELSHDHWGADGPKTYEAWRSRWKDRTGYPWSYWGKYYEDQIAPYLISRGGQVKVE